MRNNFNPFSYPYHPIQLIFFLLLVLIFIIPLLLFTSTRKIIKDIPPTIKATYVEYFKR